MTGLSLKKTLPYVGVATVVIAASLAFERLQAQTRWSAPAIPVAAPKLAEGEPPKPRQMPRQIQPRKREPDDRMPVVVLEPANGESPDLQHMQMPRQIRRNPVDTRYRGTSVEVDPKATGAMLELQRRLASIMAEQDYVPPDRPGHFQWVKRMNGTVVGWRAKIAEVTDVGGAVTVKVVVNAVQTTGATALRSSVDEYYTFDGKRLHYVRSEADPASPGVITFN